MHNDGQKFEEPLFVTTPFLPPISEYMDCVRQVWESHQLTNNGQFVRQLEQALREYLGVEHVIAVSNGDAGLRIALRALELEGEVITTPFSYVSTTSSLLWSGLEPVFCDIEPDTLTISPERIEDAITPRTTAILATHVFGNPCDVEQIGEIAKQHQLKVIYDAAHAFGVEYKGRSLLNFGDLSMVSLHATKVFHSAEGGILATDNAEHAVAAEWRRRFGHNGQLKFHGVGINAKMSELNAAMGVCVLNHIDKVFESRSKICAKYDAALAEANLPISKPIIRAHTKWNYSYYPVIFESEAQLLNTLHHLEAKNVLPRRYFYPSLNSVRELGDFSQQPIADDIARRIACLPLSTSMRGDDVQLVVSILASCL